MGKKTAFTVHDLYHFGHQSIRKAISLKIARYIIFIFTDVIHVHNQHTRQLIEKKFKRKKNVYVIPHGNYIGCYPNNISKESARDQLGLSKDAFVFLFLGLLQPYKGIEDLIDAFKASRQSRWRLVIAGREFGKGTYLPSIVNRCGNDKRIKLIPELFPMTISNYTLSHVMFLCCRTKI